MKLKRIIFIGLIGIILFPATSCMDDFLSETSYSFIGPENYYNNVDELEILVNSTYQWGQNILSNDNLFFLAETPAPVITCRAGSSSRRTTWDSWIYNASTSELLSPWENFYKYINIANTVITNGNRIDQNIEEPSGYNKVERVIGEARFIRALIYFYLTEFWGDVPLRTEEVANLDNLYVGRTSKEEIQEIIIDDLKFAESKLPQWTEYNNDQEDIGRICKAAAQTMLAKVYLTNGMYNEASEYCDKIINAGVHGLAPDFKDLWFLHNPTGSENYSALNYEIIYDIQQSRSVGRGFALSTKLAPRNSNFSISQGVLFHAEYWFVKSFENGDDRLDGAFIMEHAITRAHEGYSAREFVRYNPDSIFTDGYFEEGPAVLKWLDPDPAFYNQGEPNITILRYSDVLLMKAEALDKLGQTNQAYNYVNMVRRRAFGLDPNNSAPEVDWVPGSKENFRKELYIERLKELNMETWGTIDMRRFWDVAAPICEMSSKLEIIQPDINGNLKKVNSASPKHEINPSDKFKLFPIPTNAMDRNPELTQNPEWD